MPELNSIELHDGTVDSLTINYAEQTVDLVVSYYRFDKDATRQQATISFEGVASVEHVADLDQLAANARAGNVNHWKPSVGDETKTFIYLIEGAIIVNAKHLRLTTAAQQGAAPDGLSAADRWR